MEAFTDHCRDIVEEYVQTILIIDDGAGLSNENLTAAEEINMDDNTDPFHPNHSDDAENTENTENTEVTHSLDTLALTSAFYQLGIVAGLYQPQIAQNELPETFAAKAKKVSATADIIILDWMLKNHDSRYSKEIIKQILEQDSISGGRLRTIIIYTGESNLDQICEELYAYLNDDKLKKEESGYQITSKHLNIALYNKIDAHGTNRCIPENDLPRIALSEFTELVDGLVPAFAMKATSTVRQNTGALLVKFSSNLDTGYLAHRALLPNPEDSEVLMLENYASYLRNVLALAQVDRKTLGYEKINIWVNASYNNCYKKAEITGDNEIEEITFTRASFTEAFVNSSNSSGDNLFQAVLSSTITRKSTNASTNTNTNVSRTKAKSMLNKHKNIECIVGTLGSSVDAVKKSSQELAALTAFKRTYKDLHEGIPYLTQGTLIKSSSSNDYFVCVMPKCDTARVNTERSFSFAKLEINNETYDLIAPDITQMDSYIHLKTNFKFYELENIRFSPNDSSKIVASKIDGNIVFTSKEEIEYQWIGDLKDLDIQNKVSSIVGDFNRIGVDEIEWVRRRKASSMHR